MPTLLGPSAYRFLSPGFKGKQASTISHIYALITRTDQIWDGFYMSFVGENTVLLLGSGVSSFQPDRSAVSSLPTGREVVTAIISRLIPKSRDDNRFRLLIEQTPFEQILEHHPRPGQIKEAISQFFLVTDYNAVHLTIAEEVKKGKVAGIVTTNYDLCIEGALNHLGVPFHTIVYGHETKELPGIPLLKVHGSAGHPTSIVATLSDEFQLPGWKVETMRRLIGGRHCLVLGYSGLDFDICPILLSRRLSEQSIVWAEPSRNLSVNLRTAKARRLVDHREAAFDVSLGRSRLGKLKWNDGSAGPLVEAIFRGLTPADLHRWRFDLLNSLAHVRYMKQVIGDATADGSVDSIELDVWNSDVAEREGRYVDSVELLKRARSNLRRIDHRRAVTVEQTLIGRIYTSRRTTDFMRALIMHTISLRWLGRQHRADLLYLYGLAAKGAYKSIEGRRYARAPRIIIGFVGRVLLKLAAGAFFRMGKWGRVYLCQVQLQDLGGTLRLTRLGLAYVLNSAKDGFEHLNNFVGQISADRKHNRERFSDPRDTLAVVKDLEWLELYPEIWKLADEAFQPSWTNHPDEAREIIRTGLRCLATSQISDAIKGGIERRLRANLLAFGAHPN